MQRIAVEELINREENSFPGIFTVFDVGVTWAESFRFSVLSEANLDSSVLLGRI
jgi:hypothetical protein